MNITTDDKHMWLIPFTSGSDHTLTVRFGQPQTIAGFRIWNYNKSPEDSYRGVRVKSGLCFSEWICSVQQVCSLVFFSTHTSCAVCFLQLKVVHVFLDGVCISPLGGFLIRKGPGNCHFDFAQEILFIDYLQSNTSTAAHNRTLTTTSKTTEDTHAHWYSTLSILLHSSLCNNLNSTYFLSSWGMKLFVCVFRSRNRRDELASMDYEAPLMPCGCILAFAYWWYSL